MAILRLLWFFAFAMLAVWFAATNHSPVQLSLVPLPWVISLPPYILVLAGIFFGLIFGMFFSWRRSLAYKRKMREKMRQQKDLSLRRERNNNQATNTTNALLSSERN